MGKFLITVLVCIITVGAGYGYAAFKTTPVDYSKVSPEFEKPVLTVSGGCLRCIEKELKSARGLDYVILGYTGGEYALPTKKDFRRGRPCHNVATQLLFSPSLYDTENIINIFIKSVVELREHERKRWQQENKYDLIFYSEDQEQTKVIRFFMEKANEALGKDKKVNYAIRAADVFWVADSMDQRFFNSYEDAIRAERARLRANSESYIGRKLSKLEQLKENKNSIYNLNSNE